MTQRFKRTQLIEGEWSHSAQRFFHSKRNVKVGDIVVATGTRGKYYEVLAIEDVPEETLRWHHDINFDLVLSKRFDGFRDRGLVKSRGRIFKTRSGWYDIVTPINEEIAAQVAELCKE